MHDTHSPSLVDVEEEAEEEEEVEDVDADKHSFLWGSVSDDGLAYMRMCVCVQEGKSLISWLSRWTVPP